MSFGENLKRLRTSRGLTQNDLALYLNVTRPTIAGYETKGKEPDYETLIQLSEYFDVSIDYLIKGPTYVKRNNNSKELQITVTTTSNKNSTQLLEICNSILYLKKNDLDKLSDYVNLLLLQKDYN
jgi:transcriptional regulator with XRE-family HTH domain